MLSILGDGPDTLCPAVSGLPQLCALGGHSHGHTLSLRDLQGLLHSHSRALDILFGLNKTKPAGQHGSEVER